MHLKMIKRSKNLKKIHNYILNLNFDLGNKFYVWKAS